MNEFQEIESKENAPSEMKREVISSVDMAVFFSKVIEMFSLRMGQAMISMFANDDPDNSHSDPTPS
jgi:hypothetical protein